MSYFKNVMSFDDLKSQYRKLAKEHHPDAGGDVKAMQDINNEYDQLFIVWKRRSNVITDETAHSTRSEFYTQNGWKGENYKSGLSLKEIACKIREFIKIHYNDFKFSVTTDYHSLSQSLSIALMEGPCAACKTYAELTEEERADVRRTHMCINNIHSYKIAEIDKEIAEIFDEQYARKYLTDYIKDAADTVEDYANSFNWSDCDGMIDFFDVDFWFDGVNIGKWDKPYKIVKRARQHVPAAEYENVEITKTRTYKTLQPKEIPMPERFEHGQLFRLKNNFNYGCTKGAVYQIDRISNSIIYAYKLGKGYKNVRKGNIRGNSFIAQIDKLIQWIDRDAIAFVELKEVTKTEEYKSVVRRSKKQTGVSTTVYESTNKDYTITPDVDTRDDSPLWVVKLTKRIEHSDFLAIRKQIEGLGGYYSRFKHGFIFKFDPMETLKNFSVVS